MRRLNVKLTLWLIGITLFSVVGVHFLHGYQIDRNAEFLRMQAQTAEKNGDSKEAIKQYNQYLKYRDDPDGYSALAGLVVEIAKETDATRQDKFKAYNTLEVAIRRHPDLEAVRRRLIDYLMLPEVRRYPEAMEHVKYLFDHEKGDSGLEYKRALCLWKNGEESDALKQLYSLVGFDEASNQFKPEPSAGAKEVEAFELLAMILGLKTDGRKQADAVMKQLVDLNPDLPKAHLTYSSYLAGHAAKAAQVAVSATARKDSLGQAKAEEEAKALFAEAKQSLDRAFELAPDDIDVILAAGAFAMSNREFAKAQELFDKALQKDPNRQDVYVRLAQLEISQNNPKAAAEQLERGLQQANDIHAILQMLVEIQFQLNDLDGVRVTCKMMREKGNFVPEFVRYQEARIDMADGDFTEASRELEAVRPSLNRSGYVSLVAQLDFLLSRCYESLGQPDRQLEVCRRILQTIPDQLGARLGEVNSLQLLGRFTEAENTLRILFANVADLGYYRAPVLQFLINDQLSKPEADRDWSEVEAVAELMYQDKSRAESDNMLLKSELLLLKNDLDAAQQILTVARKQYPKEAPVWVALAKLLLRQDRADRIGQLLNLAEKEVGDSVLLRQERARAILRQGGENVAVELAKLEANFDKLSEPNQVSLMFQFGNAYLQIRDFENTKRCWKFAADHQPSNGQIRQTLFELAVDMKDPAEMEAIIKALGESRYFGTQSPLYNYCASTLMLFPLTSQNRATAKPLSTADRAVIADARRLVDKAIAVRGEWSVLWRVRGEIDQLEGNIADAITNYQRSLDFSHVGQVATARRLVQLLYVSRRYAEASEALKFVGPIGPSDVLSKIKEDIQVRGGKKEDIDAALAMAANATHAEPDKASNYVWYASLLDRAGRPDDAEQAFRKAVEVGPKQPENWDPLVRHLLGVKKKAEAVEAVRQASTAMSENPTAVAMLFERVADQVQAEHFYKAALEEHPDDLAALRNVAAYYIRNGRGPDAAEYLDQIIKTTAQSTKKEELAQLFWARRYKAQNLATPHTAQEPPDYEQVVRATKLIEQNMQDGLLAPEDIRVIVALLANRPEPESRAKAIRLLEQLKQRQLITAREQLAVGQLQDRAGNWAQARDWMFSALSRSSEDPEILTVLVQMLIRHEEYDEATRWVERLDEIMAKSPVPRADILKANVRELKARLLIKKGEPEQAVQVLEGLVPNPLPQNQLFLLEKVANLLEELKQFAAAEKLLNEYMSLEPRGTIAMAAFLGRRGDIEKAFGLLEEARKNQPAVEILPCALDALRRHPDKASKERFASVEEWTDSGLKQEANSQQIQLLAAELYDLEGRYPEVVKIYRDLLNSPGANEHQKAIVKNNLAFVLAITSNAPQTAAESLKLINEAMRVLGPNSDLLDTRALGYLASGDVKKALADLRAAATDSPSSSKFFHLAEAEKRANNIEKAREALDKAQTLGLDVNRLTPLEKQNYTRLTGELK
ncbi:MAG: tetratricopeptide repeat protein [Planctomycetia bacterium]|nr:tetratricopeptide repeat protein [Planctomycetia bacterium]